jgi:3-oxoacyl-[acyl-carrier-protein] synthase-3
VLLIAANVLSRRVNPTDQKTAVVFGDGAGAFVLASHHKASAGVLGSDFASDGAYYECVSIPKGGSREPFSEATSWTDTVIALHSGAVVFSKVVDMMVATSEQVLKKTGLYMRDITRWVPHQGNGRILESARHRLHIPQASMVTTLEEFGNTSAASLAFSLAMDLDKKPLQEGERLLLTAVGAGLSGGALVFSGM